MPGSDGRLERTLGLADVYAIAAGAMFSSGFFLLPGIAAGMTGGSVVVAYLLSAVLIIPAMLSIAELSTAMPRSGGAYYFIDRALGPLTGTFGGIGTWLTLVLKSAFAALGIGIYVAALMPGAPAVTIALVSAVAFALLNIVGAKETSGMQRGLVYVLLAVMGLFIVHGLWEGVSGRLTGRDAGRLPFLANGVDGLLATVGMVFVSYMGLTKVASVAEEIKRPGRNIPLGMTLALATVSAVYAFGVWVVMAALEPAALVASKAPVTDAAEVFFRWVPAGAAAGLIAVAALAAFASTANAGIMSASRYLLAMARDRLLPARLAHVGARGTPVAAVALTAVAICAVLVVFDVAAMAKLAGAFQLVIFMLIHVAVIVMRESDIVGYAPAFRSPGYPWVQVFGLVTPLFLIAEMGWLPTLFCTGLAVVSTFWYLRYARPRVTRRGALYHVFARLGRNRFSGLDDELREVVQEMGLRPGDAYDDVVARAPVVDLGPDAGLRDAVVRAAGLMGGRLGVAREAVAAALSRGIDEGLTPVGGGVAIPHARLAGLDHAEMVLLRCREGLRPGAGDAATAEPVRAVVCLLSPADDAALHLRVLSQIASHAVEPCFMERWCEATRPQQLREVLLRDERHLSVELAVGAQAASWMGCPAQGLDLPDDVLLAVIRRDGVPHVPSRRTVLREGDRLTFIGSAVGIEKLRAVLAADPERLISAAA
jgi:amino acid transporter/mannitol/fructose-specific phosphotransferase system IIA component (Ntr-type)